jgi:hypothetical protein
MELQKEMSEFVDEFLQEIDKIERFYNEKCHYYQNEFKTLKEAYTKFYFKDSKFQKKGAKLKRIKNIKDIEEKHDIEESPNKKLSDLE